MMFCTALRLLPDAFKAALEKVLGTTQSLCVLVPFLAAAESTAERGMAMPTPRRTLSALIASSPRFGREYELDTSLESKAER